MTGNGIISCYGDFTYALSFGASNLCLADFHAPSAINFPFVDAPPKQKYLINTGVIAGTGADRSG